VSSSSSDIWTQNERLFLCMNENDKKFEEMLKLIKF
jgi:hypothetical protein